MEAARPDDRIRLAERMAALSLATDLGLGQPVGHELGSACRRLSWPTGFAQQLEAFAGYLPDAERIRANAVPLRVLVSTDGTAQLARATARFAAQLGLRMDSVSGHHAPYLQRPEAFADELRPILRELS